MRSAKCTLTFHRSTLSVRVSHVKVPSIKRCSVTRPAVQSCSQGDDRGRRVGPSRPLDLRIVPGLFRALASRFPAVELTDNVYQRDEWEPTALDEFRAGSVTKAMDMYRHRGRLVVALTRDDTLARAVGDWYLHVAATGDFADALLVAYDNDTVAMLNEQARGLLAASRQRQEGLQHRRLVRRHHHRRTTYRRLPIRLNS